MKYRICYNIPDRPQRLFPAIPPVKPKAARKSEAASQRFFKNLSITMTAGEL